MVRKFPLGIQRSESGIALVLVLTMLVLLSALLIAFMTAASTETAASKASAQQIEARQAADAAVNLVIGQIRDATTSVDDGASPDPSKTGAQGFTWASQPGAIRTYGNGASVYKLYSATRMRESETDYMQSDSQAARLDAGEGISDDKLEESGFVDLNEPALVPADPSTQNDEEGSDRFEPRYPIVNPYGKFTYSQASGKFNTTSNPAVPGTGAIEGFYAETVSDPDRKDADGNPIPLLPLRVKWMYILKDGSFAPVDDSGKIMGAKEENPPVARTAFWTDDESAKLNINTATEGTFWDTPSVGTYQESGQASGPLSAVESMDPSVTLNMAVSQPARNEYQRYPAHPATTSLSPAIRWLFPNYRYPMLPNDPDIAFKEAVYRMAPRIIGGKNSRNASTNLANNGTSVAGTFVTDNDTGTSTNVVTPPIEVDKDRLFATIDEYFFRPDRTGRNQQIKLDAYLGQDIPNPQFRPEHIDKLRFFLTTNSRSPELTMFGTPRVTTWPLYRVDNTADDKRTGFDDTFAFCSTLGGKPYFFTRKNPLSATDDFVNSADNQRIYKYLQSVTNRKIPWINKSFVDKYELKNRDQLLTQIFDYIRCTNLVDTSSAIRAGNQLYSAAYTPFYWPRRQRQNEMPAAYSGQVAPIRITTDSGIETQGFGRFVTVSEAALLFYRATAGAATAPFQMRCVLLMEMFTPAQGFPALRDTYSVRVRIGSVDQNADIGDTPVSDAEADHFQARAFGAPPEENVNLFPTDMYNIVSVDAYTSPVARVFMPFRGFQNQFLWDRGWNGNWTNQASFPPHAWTDADPKTFVHQGFSSGARMDAYPFFSLPVTLPGNTTKFAFKGGTFVIDIYARARPLPNDRPVQTLRIKFQDAPDGWPVPTTASVNFPTRLTRGIDGDRNQLDPNNAASGFQWITRGDVIRSYEIGGKSMGDQRLAMALPRVNYGGERTNRFQFTQEFYQPRGGYAGVNGYNSSTRLQVQGLRAGRGGFYPANTIDLNYNIDDGRLVARSLGSTVRNERQPRLPLNGMLPGGGAVPIDGVRFLSGNTVGHWGDWDRGLSKNVSGAFINKPDEGNFNFNWGSTGGTRLPYFLGYGGFEEAGPVFFTPNRIMPGPVMFGSLPTQTLDGRPWQTLLFRPAAEPVATPHPGSLPPHDHYLLDFFHMPIVEPYAISEPFSTAGKVNLNFEIAPFGYVKVANRPYLERKTALHGLLKSQKMLMVPNNAPDGGHRENPLDDRSNRWRYSIDRTKTIELIQNRLTKKGLFKTASELCEIPMVPASGPGQSVNGLANPIANMSDAQWANFWNQYLQTGDNQRERPYVHLYPRVTNRSNVYTVYVRAQSIRKAPGSAVDEFDPRKDQVTSEYRGQTTIERFIDPNDPQLRTYNPSSNSNTIGGAADRYYRFRIVNSKQFIGS